MTIDSYIQTLVLLQCQTTTNILKLKTYNTMKTLDLIEKVNNLTKSSFTKIVKARKNSGACFLILAMHDGGSIYGSYSSKAIYYIDSNENAYSFR